MHLFFYLESRARPPNSPSSRSGLCHEPVLLHDLNVRIYVPDMPDEYFKLPYPSAKSDMLRYGVLYHHGGIYMDADLLAQVSAAINQWHLNKPWESYMTCVPIRITSCPFHGPIFPKVKCKQANMNETVT